MKTTKLISIFAMVLISLSYVYADCLVTGPGVPDTGLTGYYSNPGDRINGYIVADSAGNQYYHNPEDNLNYPISGYTQGTSLVDYFIESDEMAHPERYTADYHPATIDTVQPEPDAPDAASQGVNTVPSSSLSTTTTLTQDQIDLLMQDNMNNGQPVIPPSNSFGGTSGGILTGQGLSATPAAPSRTDVDVSSAYAVTPTTVGQYEPSATPDANGNVPLYQYGTSTQIGTYNPSTRQTTLNDGATVSDPYDPNGRTGTAHVNVDGSSSVTWTDQTTTQVAAPPTTVQPSGRGGTVPTPPSLSPGAGLIYNNIPSSSVISANGINYITYNNVQYHSVNGIWTNADGTVAVPDSSDLAAALNLVNANNPPAPATPIPSQPTVTGTFGPPGGLGVTPSMIAAADAARAAQEAQAAADLASANLADQLRGMRETPVPGIFGQQADIFNSQVHITEVTTNEQMAAMISAAGLTADETGYTQDELTTGNVNPSDRANLQNWIEFNSMVDGSGRVWVYNTQTGVYSQVVGNDIVGTAQGDTRNVLDAARLDINVNDPCPITLCHDPTATWNGVAYESTSTVSLGIFGNLFTIHTQHYNADGTPTANDVQWMNNVQGVLNGLANFLQGQYGALAGLFYTQGDYDDVLFNQDSAFQRAIFGGPIQLAAEACRLNAFRSVTFTGSVHPDVATGIGGASATFNAEKTTINNPGGNHTYLYRMSWRVVPGDGNSCTDRHNFIMDAGTNQEKLIYNYEWDTSTMGKDEKLGQSMYFTSSSTNYARLCIVFTSQSPGGCVCNSACHRVGSHDNVMCNNVVDSDASANDYYTQQAQAAAAAQGGTGGTGTPPPTPPPTTQQI